MSFPKPPDGASALPLASLPAVAFDTETTGLDTAQDRVIEVAAVRFSGGNLDLDDSYTALIKPDIPIPEGATLIHGIRDEDVAGAPDFASAFKSFTTWLGPAILIGHSLAFDLAILESESRRCRTTWRPPRILDVRSLIQVLGQDLPDWSLETLASWLGIPVVDRHRALADAILAGRIFHALIPKLREHGVFTLAQAERACRSGQQRVAVKAAESWRGTDSSGLDVYPYRYRVGDIMSPPSCIAHDATVSDALRQMTTMRESAIYVLSQEEPGIVTERDILNSLHRRGATVLTARVETICSHPLQTVGQDEFLYRAMILMTRNGFRHLGVTGPDGSLVGTLDSLGLLGQRAADAISLGSQIESAASGAELGSIWDGLFTVVGKLAAEEIDARFIAAIISSELRALTRRACEIAEASLTEARPRSYAMLVLGSGGRGESLLAMDQDNAIVYLDGPDGGESWCEALGRRVADILDEAGVSYCKGGVMAANAPWRRTLSGWQEAVQTWLTRTRPEDILNADIFFDATAVHGDARLAESLLDQSRTAAGKALPFLRLLAANVAKRPQPVDWLGRPKFRQGRIDLKMNGIMPIFSASRILALEHGIATRSTAGRLREAKAREIAHPTLVDDLLEIHESFLGMILGQQLLDLRNGVPLSNRVSQRELTNAERQHLVWALRRVGDVVDLLGVPA